MKLPGIKPLISVLIILAVGLAFFFAVSADLPDGLERTVEHGDVEEGEPYYDAPLDYGGDYTSALLAGFLGLVLALLIVIGLGLILRKRNAQT
jgi:hypothetical protein